MRTTSWSGDDWQAYCDELLIARHGADYQRIPDTLGDYGAEGYTASGTLVQAYAAEEIVDAKKLYEAQRDKVTRDLGKIAKNRAHLSRMLGRPIARVIFLVPEIRTKELLNHCAGKAEALRAEGLAEFNDDFDIRVLTADDFPEERRRLGENLGASLGIAAVEVSEDNEAAWVQSHSDWASSLARKLESIPTLDDGSRASLGETLIRMYLRKEDVLRQLRTNYPALWETIRARTTSREQSLAAENLLHQGSQQTRLTDLVKEVESRLTEDAPGLKANGVDLGWGTVAEWLLRCPLELSTTAANE